MPISKNFLLDVNCWLAAAAQRHVHHPKAKSWMDSADGQFVFCRVTQMGFLRLTTNPKVMGDDVLTPAEAWSTYEKLRSDSRVVFADEPAGLERAWRKLTEQPNFTRTRWTDSYLAAFADAGGHEVVTFDNDFHQLASVEVHVLA
jgi:uncharacterized protein